MEAEPLSLNKRNSNSLICFPAERGSAYTVPIYLVSRIYLIRIFLSCQALRFLFQFRNLLADYILSSFLRLRGIKRADQAGMTGYFHSNSEQKYILTTQLEWNIILLKTKKDDAAIQRSKR